MTGRRKNQRVESDGEDNQLSLRTPARRLSMIEGESSTSPLTPPPADVAPAWVEQTTTNRREKGKGRRRDSEMVEDVPSKKKPKITLKVSPTDAQHPGYPAEDGIRRPGQAMGEAAAEMLAQEKLRSETKSATSALPTINQEYSPPGRSEDRMPTIPVPRSNVKKPKAERPHLLAHPLQSSDSRAASDKDRPALSRGLTNETAPTSTEVETELSSKTSQVTESGTVETVKRGVKSRMAEPDSLSTARAKLDLPINPGTSPSDASVVVKRSAKGRKVNRVIRSPEPDVAEETTDPPTSDKRRSVEPSQVEKTLEEERPTAIVKEKRKKQSDMDSTTTTKISNPPSADQLVERSSPALLSPALGEASKQSPSKAHRILPKVNKRPVVESAKDLSKPATDGERRLVPDAASVKNPVIPTRKVPAPMPAVPSLLQGTLAALQGAGQPKPKPGVAKQVCSFTSQSVRKLMLAQT